jgi:cytochrome b561
VNRICTKLPPFPPTMSRQERFLAWSSEKLLYALMFALPLVGWGMLSAGHYPIVMFGPVHLPPILPSQASPGLSCRNVIELGYCLGRHREGEFRGGRSCCCSLWRFFIRW